MTTRSCLPERSSHFWALGIFALLAALACVALFASARSGAVEYHTTCVGHGWVAGSSPSDGSAFSRIETGCGTTARECKLYNWGTFLGSQITTTTTCNAWLRDYGNYTECASYAKLNFPAAFSEHNHTPDDYCAGLRAVASESVDSVDPIPDQPMADTPDVTPTSTAVIGATAPDPNGGPDFAVRVYRSETGETCPEGARTRDGEFGQQYADGWQTLPLASAGSCADLAATPVGLAVGIHPAQGDIPAYELMFGAVSDQVTAVDAQIAGTSHHLPLVAGTFILPADPAHTTSSDTLTATLTSGKTITYPIPTTNP